MPDYDYFIIGGGIAGTTAAETIRQRDKDGSIAILSGEPHFLYSRVLLPEFIRREVGLEKVMLRAKADYKKNGIDIFLGESAESFDPENMTLKTDKGSEFRAKKVLIASGGKPKPWDSQNGQSLALTTIGQSKALAKFGVFRLQTLDDANKLKDFLARNSSGKALIVGGGFMALEFIEVLKHFGWKVTLLCKEPRFWPDFLDEDGSEILADLWRENRVELIFEDEIEGFQSQNGQSLALTKKGKELDADIICVGIGLARNLDYLLDTRYPADVGYLVSNNGVRVNDYLETKFSNVWAAGDVALYPDPFSERMRAGGNWSGSFMQGRIAGLNMTGSKENLKNVSAYAISHLGTSVAFIGDVGPFDGSFGAEGKAIHFDKEKKEYARVFIKNKAVMGAALINGQRFMGGVNRAIMNKWDAGKITLE